MKKIISCLLLAIACQLGYAQSQVSCDAVHRVRIFFGNGIWKSAKGSIIDQRLLADAAGSEQDGSDLVYDTAYNTSENAFIDLLQSFVQKEVEFYSAFFLWINDAKTAPDWFIKQTGDLEVAAYKVIASDVIIQIGQYQSALSSGEKVLVIAHSQGNLYVNVAKQALLATTPVPPMTAFGIYAIATPAINVGGASGPYLTNDRDMIQYIGLSANLTLRYVSDGRAASDVSLLQGHYMDTYLDEGFNARAELIKGVHAAIANLSDPIPDCPPPPPPSSPPTTPGAGSSSIDISYLPAKFAGYSAHRDNCGPKQQNGDIGIGSDGSVAGSGCYEVATYPVGSTYTFSQDDRTPTTFRNALSIFVGSGSSPDYFSLLNPMRLPNNTVVAFGYVSTPSVGANFEAPLAGLRIDAIARIKTGLQAIAGRPCTAGTGTPPLIENAFVEVNDSTVSIKQGQTVIATGEFAALTAGDITFAENYGVFSGRLDQLSMTFSRTGDSQTLRQVSLLWLHKGQPNVFQFDAVGMAIPGGQTSAQVSCSAS